MKIRIYNSRDFKPIVRLLEELLDLMVEIDNMGRSRRLASWGEKHAKSLLGEVKKNSGIIFVAEDKRGVVGCIVGLIENQTKKELMENKPTKAVRIVELIVKKSCRKKGTGKKLMSEMEAYFEKMNCDAIRVEVFAPNKSAHKFYNRLGYEDRSIDLIKIIKPPKRE